MTQAILGGSELIGRSIGGKFQLKRLIGQGASGTVYQADQMALGRSVAVKILRPELAQDPQLVARFSDEATAASRLNHPNTIAVIDFGQTNDGLLYLAMEYLRGRTLTDVIREEFPLGTDRIVGIVEQVLSGLEEAHHHGVVHADLKSDNIVVERRRGQWELAKVVDFGVARIIGETNETSGSISGTPEYMSPEVIGGTPPTFASDLYAVGIILYEMLTGSTPFAGGSVVEVLSRHLQLKPEPPQLRRPDIQMPAALEQLVLRALAKKPEDRYATASEFRAVLVDSGDAQGQPAPAQDTVCASCGARSPHPFNFCPECGARREAQVPQPAGSVEYIADVSTTKLFPLPFVGRVTARTELVAYMYSGKTQGIQLVGPPGCGRTHLIHEACQTVGAMSNTPEIVLANPDPSGRQSGFYPIRSVVATLLGLPGVCGLDDIKAALTRLGLNERDVPGIIELFGLKGDLWYLEPPVRRRELFAATTRVIQAAATRRRVVLIFDDADGYDPPSRELLRRLLEREASDNLRVVISNTPDTASMWPSWVARVNLQGLDATALRSLQEHLEAHLPETIGKAGAILASSGGHPATIANLARLLVEGVSELDAYRDASLADIFAARLDLLPRDALWLCQAAASFGREVSVELLRQMLVGRLDDAAFDAALELVESRDLVSLDQGLVVFRASLLRDVVYDSTPAEVRRALHAKVVEALGRDSEPATIIGHHLELSNDYSAAAQMLMKAGDTCVHQFNDQGASECYQRALACARHELLAEQEDASAQFIALSVKLAESLRLGGELTLARGILEEAMHYCQGLPVLHARLLQAYAHLWATDGKAEIAIKTLRGALGHAIPAGDTALVIELYLDLSAVYLGEGDSAMAIEELDEALSIATLGQGGSVETGPDNLWRLLFRIAQLREAAGLVNEAVDCAHAALRHATRVSSRLGMAKAQVMLAHGYDKLGNTQKAARFRESAVAEMRRIGDRRGTAELLLGSMQPSRRFPRASSESLREAHDLAKEVGWEDGAAAATRDNIVSS